jgi:hypothetical protein
MIIKHMARFKIPSRFIVIALAFINLLCLQSVLGGLIKDWVAEEQSCSDNMFPISVGGDFDDFVNCTIFDEVN